MTGRTWIRSGVYSCMYSIERQQSLCLAFFAFTGPVGNRNRVE